MISGKYKWNFKYCKFKSEMLRTGCCGTAGEGIMVLIGTSTPWPCIVLPSSKCVFQWQRRNLWLAIVYKSFLKCWEFPWWLCGSWFQVRVFFLWWLYLEHNREKRLGYISLSRKRVSWFIAIYRGFDISKIWYSAKISSGDWAFTHFFYTRLIWLWTGRFIRRLRINDLEWSYWNRWL